MTVLTKDPGQFRGTLVIGLKTTPQKSDLPFVPEEIERVHNVMFDTPLRKLIGSEATIGAVLDGLESPSIGARGAQENTGGS
ncbi:hypothetical protein FRC09_000727 [Ceratobasidium sp. 395]|nr:hypothetical protein FRC09_000727 [Ceratobasidium sp. 395]